MQKHKVEETKVDSLKVQVYDSSESLGDASAAFVAERLKEILEDQGHANVIFATGASQFNFLKALRVDTSIDWSNVTTFHLDEYVGISPQHKASFRKYLHERIIDEIKPGEAHFLEGDAEDISKEVNRYEELLKNHPIDIACIGIGENAHIAFNDPPIADFNDPHLVKVVELDKKSRQQQVDEGWFDTIDDVPKQALSLTIPAITRSKIVSCVVPDERKAEAVYHTLNDEITTEVPATILRNHSDATLFLDIPSASKLKKN